MKSHSSKFLALAVVLLLTVALLAACGGAQPTQAPAAEPTKAPVAEPTKAPEAAPTKAPEVAPTKAPEAAPTTAAAAEPTKAAEQPAAEKQAYYEVNALTSLPYFIDHQVGLYFAGKALGVDTPYVGPADYDMTAMVNAMEQAIATNPQGINIVGFDPALKPSIDAAVDAASRW